MRNILKIFYTDLKGLIKNKLALTIAIGVCFLPSLYAWFNIYSNWDPYANTSNIKVAVSSDDRGWANKDGSFVNMGDQVIDGLRSNTAIDWQFVDSSTAIDGVNTGEYYAAIVIGKNFSESMYNFYETKLERPSVTYYENQKKNAVASKITDSAKSTVQKSINTSFVSVVVERVAEGFNDATDGKENPELILELVEKLDSLNTSLDSYIGTVDSLIMCCNSLSQNLSAAGNSLTDASDATPGNIENIKDAQDKTNASMDRLSKAIDKSVEIIMTEIKNAQDSLNKPNPTQKDVSSAINSLDKVQKEVDKLGSTINESSSVSSSSKDSFNKVTSAVSTSTSAAKKELENALNGTNSGNGGTSGGNTTGSNQQQESQTDSSSQSQQESQTDSSSQGQQTSQDGSQIDLHVNTQNGIQNNIENNLNQTVSNTVGLTDTQIQMVNSTLNILESIIPIVENQMQKDIASIKLDLNDAYDNMIDAVENLGNGLLGSSIAADNMSQTMGSAAISLDGMKDVLVAANKKVGDAKESLEEIEDSGNYEKLISLVIEDPKSSGEFFSGPVQTNTHSIYEAKNYGSSVTPFYTILALWVGCVILVSIIKVDVTKVSGLKDMRPFEIYFGRMILFFIMGQIQALVTVLGDLFLLKVQCENPILFYIDAAFSSMIFCLLIYTLTTSFGDIGKAVVVIVMVLQIAGSSGTYPIEILPEFNQKIYIYFPFPYAINAMRESMFGMYHDDYWVYFGELSIFGIIALFVGLVIRQPFMKILHYMEHRMKDTKMM